MRSVRLSFRHGCPREESWLKQGVTGSAMISSDREYVSLDTIASDVGQRKQLTETDAVVLLAENEKTTYAATDDLL